MLMSNLALRICFSITLGILTFFLADLFFDLSYSLLKPAVIMHSGAIESNYNSRLILTLNLALLPFIFGAIRRWIGIEKLKNLTLLAIAPIVFGLLFWYFRILYLKSVAAYSFTVNGFGAMEQTLPSNQLHIETYFLVGTLFGLIFIAAIFALLNRRKSNDTSDQ